jgi:two-component system sensor histidine kinase BaeS
MSPSGGERGLAARLFVAQLLVVVVAAVTLWLVAAAVGPPIFRSHLHHAVGHVEASTSRHVEEAFRSASAVSIGVAMGAALVAALVISFYVSRRIAGPVSRLAAAARSVAAGEYTVRVEAPGLGEEFSTLTGSFNAMAERLKTIEVARRRLLGDLAHEMRTPVSTIDAYLEGLEDGVVPVDADTLAMLRTQTARLSRLADDVTAVSRAEEHQLDLQLAPAAPAELVTAAGDAFRDRAATAGVQLLTEVTPGLPMVRVDSERFAQVLGNLLDNALRHTPARGTVTVAADPAGDRVQFTVHDTGAGIPPEHLPHVFERFYRVDRARDRDHGGSGIGLTIVKALVEAQGGTVTAASDGSGRGATFIVTMPAMP